MATSCESSDTDTDSMFRGDITSYDFEAMIKQNDRDQEKNRLVQEILALLGNIPVSTMAIDASILPAQHTDGNSLSEPLVGLDVVVLQRLVDLFGPVQLPPNLRETEAKKLKFVVDKGFAHGRKFSRSIFNEDSALSQRLAADFGKAKLNKKAIDIVMSYNSDVKAQKEGGHTFVSHLDAAVFKEMAVEFGDYKAVVRAGETVVGYAQPGKGNVVFRNFGKDKKSKTKDSDMGKSKGKRQVPKASKPGKDKPAISHTSRNNVSKSSPAGRVESTET